MCEAHHMARGLVEDEVLLDGHLIVEERNVLLVVRQL